MRKKEIQEEAIAEPELRADQMLSEEMVPEHMIKRGDYTAGGFRCRKCEFSTLKQGFSGRQALRAHLKVHTLERRAWVRPLLRQGLLSAVLVGSGAAAYFLSTPRGLVGGAIDLDVPGWVFTATGLTAVLALLITSEYTGGSLARRGIASGWVVVAMADLVGALACTAIWISTQPGWPHLIAVAVMLLVAPLTAANLGECAHANRRGRWRSRRYLPIFRPRDEDAESAYSAWRKGIVNNVLRGRLSLEDLSGEFKEYVISRVERFRRIGK